MSVIKKRGVNKPIKRSSKYASIKRKDVYIKTFRNALFPKQKSLREILPYKLIILTICIGIFLFGIYYILFSKDNKITDIRINGSDIEITQHVYDVASIYLGDSKLFFLQNDNVYFFSEDRLRQEIFNEVPFYNIDIEVQKPYLDITIGNQQGVAHWRENNETYLISSSGAPFKKLPSYSTHTETIDKQSNTKYEISLMLDTDALPLVYNPFSTYDFDHDTVNTDFINNIVRLNDILAKETDLKITSYEIVSLPGNVVKAKTLEAWTVYFLMDNKDSISNQALRLKILLSQKLNDEERLSLEYVDLRAGERVFYR